MSNKMYVKIPKDIVWLDPFSVDEKPFIARMKDEAGNTVEKQLNPYTFRDFTLQILQNPVFHESGLAGISAAINIMNSLKNLLNPPVGANYIGIMELLKEDYDLFKKAVEAPKYKYNDIVKTDYGLAIPALTPQLMPFISAVVYQATADKPIG